MATTHIKFEDYSFDVDMDCFDDVRFFEMTDRLEADPKLHIDILKLAIGESGYKEFAAHFEKKDGKLKMSKVISAVAAIFNAADPKESASGTSESNTQTK